MGGWKRRVMLSEPACHDAHLLWMQASCWALSPTVFKNAEKSAIRRTICEKGGSERDQLDGSSDGEYPRARGVRGEKCLCHVDHGGQNDRVCRDACRRRLND